MNYTVNYNGQLYPLTDFYNLLYNIAPAKKTLYKSNISIPADAFLDDEKLTIIYEMSGIAPEDIKIKVDKSELVVTAERKPPVVDGTTLRADIVYGTYSRAFVIGQEYDIQQLQTSAKNGFLYIKIPRKPEATPTVFTVTSS